MAPPVTQTAAVAEAPGGAAQPPQQQQQQQRGFGSTISGIIRIAVFWYFASKFFSPKQKPMDPNHLMTNLFHKGERIVGYVVLSFRAMTLVTKVCFTGMRLIYLMLCGHRRVLGQDQLKYYSSETLQNNGSLYAHVFFARSGFPIDPSDPEYQPLNSFGRTHPVATYFPKREVDKKKSLLGSPKDSDESKPVCMEVFSGEILHKVVDKNSEGKEEVPGEWVSLWKPNVTINLVDDFTHYSQSGLPPNIAPHLLVEPRHRKLLPYDLLE
ncbi:Transmembrane CLPTM1 family protein [Raphanus sativus]|nr:Transmembrane CLPTM1 family protein [Raphanus sativus]